MRLRHGRVEIELHERRAGGGLPLLLLHPLGTSAASWPDGPVAWTAGAVFALDFAGHGRSGHVRGGAYHPEYFLADADVALEAIGSPCVVLGAGIGAYVALLLAGARPEQVRAAALLDGTGLTGGGSLPPHQREDAPASGRAERFAQRVEAASERFESGTDPLVGQCEDDCRPIDYVESFAGAARPLCFDARVGRDAPAPDWWAAAFAANPGATRVEGIASAVTALSGAGAAVDPDAAGETPASPVA